MKVAVRYGLAWKWRIVGGWYWHLRAVPALAVPEHERCWL